MDEVTTSDAAARVQLIETPIASPGQCTICGKSSHPVGFADPRLDFEFYGTVLFCGDCVGDFARLFGWVEPERFVEFLREHEEVLAHDAMVTEELDNLGAIKNAIDYYSSGNSHRSNGSLSVVHVPDDSTAEVIDIGLNESSATVSRTDGDDDSESVAVSEDSAEPVSIERSNDVSDAGSNEFNELIDQYEL